MKTFAKIIAVTWGIWWTYFGYMSTTGSALPLEDIVVRVAFPGLIFLLTALFTFKSDFIAPSLLLLEGLFALVLYSLLAFGNYSISTFLFLFVTMMLPPIFSGTILLIKKIAILINE
ncbi:MAG: hypothetical protein ABII27_09560 [bacterium]